VSGYLRDAAGRTCPVRDGLTLGRVSGCDVVLQDGKASRRHAKIVVEAGVVELEDLGSSNGTLLNGKPVTRRVLRGGDEIQIGATVITYVEGEAPRTAPAAAVAAPASSPSASAPASTPASTADNDLFGDDDDLFGGDAAPAPAPVPAASAAPERVPPPVAQPPVAPAPAPPSRVVEFADEVVEVKRRDEPVAKGKPAAPAAPGAVQSQQRILQFSKKDAKQGVLGDDLAQVGGGARWLVYLLVLAVGGGIAYGVITMMR
jgi:predicted component of type VI protein secretion system